MLHQHCKNISCNKYLCQNRTTTQTVHCICHLLWQQGKALTCRKKVTRMDYCIHTNSSHLYQLYTNMFYHSYWIFGTIWLFLCCYAVTMKLTRASFDYTHVQIHHQYSDSLRTINDLVTVPITVIMKRKSVKVTQSKHHSNQLSDGN